MATTGISVSQFDDAVIRGKVRMTFMKYQEPTPIYKRMGFQTIDSDSPFEEFSSMTGIGLARRRSEFQQVAIDTPKQNYTKRVHVLSYAIMIPVSDEALRFLKRGKMPMRTFLKPTAMASQALVETKEILASDVLGNAFSTDYLHPDGQPLISASHKLGRGGTGSNYIGNVSLAQESLEAALIQGRKMPSDTGLPIGVGDGEKILITNEDPSFEIERILESTLQSDTANNAKNVLKGKKIRPEANRYLPSTSNWFMRNTGVEDCIVEVVETDSLLKDFSDDKTHTMFFEAYMMVAYDFFEWRGIQGSNI